MDLLHNFVGSHYQALLSQKSSQNDDFWGQKYCRVIMKFSGPINLHFWMISGSRNHLILKISGLRMSAEAISGGRNPCSFQLLANNFPSLLALVGVTVEKVRIGSKGNHCSRFQRGIAPWSRIGPLPKGRTLATASPRGDQIPCFDKLPIPLRFL